MQLRKKYWQYNQYLPSASELFKQLLGFCRALPSGQFQPVARLQRLKGARLVVELAKGQLSIQMPRTRRLTQQLNANAAITRVATITAEHLSQAGLRLHLTLQGRLLEQTPGKALHAWGMAEV
jgi:hypothetical protein